MAADYTTDIPDPYFPTSSTRSPFIINDPHSEVADKEGLRDGKLMLDNLDGVKKLKGIKDELGNPGGLQVDLTYFKNWAGTQENLLLHVKPTTSAQIEALVKAVRELNKKGVELKVCYIAIVIGTCKGMPLFGNAWEPFSVLF